MAFLDDKFRKNPGKYLFQSSLATLTVFFVLVFIDVFTEAVIVAALGSSAFIVFAMPKRVTAKARNVIGGHSVGIIAGCFCYLVLISAFGQSSYQTRHLWIYLAGSVAVGLSILFMVITDTEHPPAAATALGLVVEGARYKTIIFVLATAIILSMAKQLLGKRLRDLV